MLKLSNASLRCDVSCVLWLVIGQKKSFGLPLVEFLSKPVGQKIISFWLFSENN